MLLCSLTFVPPPQLAITRQNRHEGINAPSPYDILPLTWTFLVFQLHIVLVWRAQAVEKYPANKKQSLFPHLKVHATGCPNSTGHLVYPSPILNKDISY